jgi:glycosyltransferase involved in cell wall biosynthesis
LIEVIPIGFDPHLFTPGWQSLEDEVVTLALLGRLVPEKGVLDAVRLLAAVTAERAARLVLVGSGPDELRARRLASELGVGERLEIVSWASSVDVAAILRTAHIVLVPSVATDTWTEQFGRVIVEAQASGAVVVGYATGSIHEVGGEPAALVRPADVRALAELARRLLRDPVEYERRRRGGIARSKGRTWIDVATRQGRLYEQAVAGVKRLELPRSPARRREVAREEFGPTAPTRTGYRPFALPVLRSAGPIARAGGRLTDAAAEVVALGHLGARIRE